MSRPQTHLAFLFVHPRSLFHCFFEWRRRAGVEIVRRVLFWFRLELDSETVLPMKDGTLTRLLYVDFGLLVPSPDNQHRSRDASFDSGIYSLSQSLFIRSPEFNAILLSLSVNIARQ
jgi:hypothetical protein